MFAIIVGASELSFRTVFERMCSLQLLNVNILLLSRELLVDVFGVIGVVRQGSVLGVLNYDELA